MIKTHTNIIAILIATTLLFTFCSCASLYGMKKNKLLSEEQIIKQAQKFNIPVADNYVLDTSYYKFLSTITDTSLLVARNNHSQPLQALYYKNEANTFKLVAYYANCYTGGFPNLNWNRNNSFSTFVPAQQAPLDNILSLKQQNEFLRSLTGVQPFNSITYDYVVFVYWTRFMGRQSKRFIKLIKDNAQLAENKKVKIVYINNDNYFANLK